MIESSPNPEPRLAGVNCFRHLAALIAFFLALFTALVPAAQILAANHLPNFDKRDGGLPSANAVSADQRDGAAQLRLRLPQARVDFDPITGAPKLISAGDGFLSGANGRGKSVSGSVGAAFAADPHGPTKAFLHEHSKLFGHGPEALDVAKVKREFVTPHNGLKTVVWEQQVDGVPVFEGILVSHTTQQGELVNLASQFVPDPIEAADRGVPNRAAALAAPAISSRAALAIAARNVGEKLEDEQITQESDAAAPAATDPEKRARFKAPFLRGQAEAALVWLPAAKDRLRLCWQIIFTSRSVGEMFRILVDAQTGEPLLRHGLTDYISGASYRVFTSDSPSPFSPGNATPVTDQPPLVSRTLVTISALNTNASPNGWIDDGVNETIGNNVDAHTDSNADNQADLPRPQGSPFRLFDFPMDLATQDPTAYSPAAVVQLFYLCNWYHDKLYELGFTEGAGNFQSNNFGRGGLGNDAVQADAQDGGGVNNANFSTPPDGSPGRMQMYIFSGPSPRRDGDLDAEVVLHEHTHGLSNRRVGGGVGISALQSQGMGEGWSDFYALALLSEAGDDVNGNYAMGGYATYLLGPSFQQNYYFGIRRYPYSTDLTKNPLTFKDIDSGQFSSHLGVPVSSVVGGGGAAEVHNQGEVWCVALWEARAALINKYGWTNGNHLILQLVTDGMNLSPVNPNFLQARNAILQADQVDTGGANQNELWAAFAKRGLGFSATSPGSSTTSGVHEAFDIPDSLSVSPDAGFVSSGPVGGPFNSNSMAFSLTNTGIVSLGWSLVSTSTWLNVSPTGGALAPAGLAAAVIATVNSSATNLAMGVYSATVWFSNANTHAVQSRQFALRVGQPDYFTELFDATANDLAFQTLTFTPDGSPGFYSLCRMPANNFPSDPTGGTAVSLSDDSFAQVTLSGTNKVGLYGNKTNVFFIGSNGYLTFNSGDLNYLESFGGHFSLPRVSALFHDLNPGAGGAISWNQLSNRVTVTYQSVPQYGFATPNNFQIEMFFDGRIRLTWLALNCLNNLVGISAGQGMPAAFLESDLTASAFCISPPSLAITLPASATEGGGLLAGAGKLSLPLVLPTNLVVNLVSSDVTEVTVPSSITVPAGQTNAAFNLTILDDAKLDGTQTPAITASAPGFQSASSSLMVLDNETAVLHVLLPASATEGQAPFQGTVQASAIPTANIVAGLTSSDTARLQVQPSVVIPAGQTSAVFTVTVIDNIVAQGPQAASITAHVPNWTDGSAAIILLDNDTPTNGVFVSPGLNSIPDHGAATPYPSPNAVAGMWGTITKMTVTISNLWHTWPADLDILLVSPSGTNVILMADAGYSYAVSGVTLTFDDDSSATLPPSSPITSGTYQPTSYETIGNNWPAPAPGPPWGTTLSVFNGTDPNGVWKLYVFDDAAADQGSISNGWRLSFTTSGPSLPFIRQPLLSAGQFKFQFATVAGHTYFVEYKNALTNPVWSALQTFVGDGTMKTVTDPMTNAQRFYRVRMQ